MIAAMLRRSALTLVVALALPAAARAQEVGLAVGTKAPASAKVETLDGKPFDLGQVVGKGPTLIEFWATWCENCEHLLPALKAAHAKYAKQVRFVGVSVSANQSPKRVQLHVAKHGVPGEQYYDKDGTATEKYDVPATSYVVVLDRNGKVVYSGIGGDQNLEAAIRKAL